MEFKLNLKLAMMERGIKPTPYYLTHSGINPQTAKQLLHGNPKSIKFEVLMELCSALNCTPKELLVVQLPEGLAPDSFGNHHLKDWFQTQTSMPLLEVQNFSPEQLEKLNHAVEQIINED
jgi:DNA-binding Xre family transcriptional regulator